MNVKKVVRSALAGVVAAGMAAGASQAIAAEHESNAKMEKCYGVVKAGKNDCGNAKHACAGQAGADRAGDEWVMLPSGACDKIVGGSTEPLES